MASFSRHWKIDSRPWCSWMAGSSRTSTRCPHGPDRFRAPSDRTGADDQWPVRCNLRCRELAATTLSHARDALRRQTPRPLRNAARCRASAHRARPRGARLVRPVSRASPVNHPQSRRGAAVCGIDGPPDAFKSNTAKPRHIADRPNTLTPGFISNSSLSERPIRSLALK